MQRDVTERDAELAELVRRIRAELVERQLAELDLLRAMGFPGVPGVLTDNGNSVGSGGPIPRTKPEQKTR
jgi:hypothetical protein